MGRYRTRHGAESLLRADLRDRRVREQIPRLDAATVITGSINGFPVTVVSTPCRLGGRRPWFRCGWCQTRVLVLYFAPWRSAWNCQRCLRLTYRSQRASRDLMLTGQLRVEALCRRFDRDWQYGDDWPEKPPRIRRATWQRFCDAVDYWEARRDEAFVAGVGRFVSSRTC